MRIISLCVAVALLTAATWHESMKQMANDLTDLVPMLVRPEVFTTPEERTAVIDKSKKILKMVHEVKDTSFRPSYDPTMDMISGDLKEYMSTSIAMMEEGRWSRGTRQMLEVSRYCIACHTLSQGPAATSIRPTLKKFSHIQKANFYAATRQFDQAIIQYEYALTNKKWAAENQAEWNDAFQKLLAVTVRVRNNPSLTLELISRFFDAKSYPTELKTVAATWRTHAKEWRQEKGKKKSQDLALSDISEIVKKAEQLQAQATEPVSFVLYLRSSALLHSFLSAKDQEKNQEALLLAGRSAEGLKDQNFWTYPEHYYKRCAEVDAKSAIGQNCAERLKTLAELKK